MKEEALTALPDECVPGFSPRLFFPLATPCFSLNSEGKKMS